MKQNYIKKKIIKDIKFHNKNLDKLDWLPKGDWVILKKIIHYFLSSVAYDQIGSAYDYIKTNFQFSSLFRITQGQDGEEMNITLLCRDGTRLMAIVLRASKDTLTNDTLIMVDTRNGFHSYLLYEIRLQEGN